MGRTTDSTLRWSGVSDYLLVTATSIQSAAIGANISEIRVVCSVACHVNIGADPTAVASDNNGFPLPANVVEYFHVTPGQKVAIVRDSADGVACVASMTR